MTSVKKQYKLVSQCLHMFFIKLSTVHATHTTQQRAATQWLGTSYDVLDSEGSVHQPSQQSSRSLWSERSCLKDVDMRPLHAQWNAGSSLSIGIDLTLCHLYAAITHKLWITHNNSTKHKT